MNVNLKDSFHLYVRYVGGVVKVTLIQDYKNQGVHYSLGKHYEYKKGINYTKLREGHG